MHWNNHLTNIYFLAIKDVSYCLLACRNHITGAINHQILRGYIDDMSTQQFIEKPLNEKAVLISSLGMH